MQGMQKFSPSSPLVSSADGAKTINLYDCTAFIPSCSNVCKDEGELCFRLTSFNEASNIIWF